MCFAIDHGIVPQYMYSHNRTSETSDTLKTIRRVQLFVLCREVVLFLEVLCVSELYNIGRVFLRPQASVLCREVYTLHPYLLSGVHRTGLVQGRHEIWRPKGIDMRLYSSRAMEPHRRIGIFKIDHCMQLDGTIIIYS